MRLEKLVGNSLSVYLSLSSISPLNLKDPPSYYFLYGPDIASGAHSEDFKTSFKSGFLSLWAFIVLAYSLSSYYSLQQTFPISSYKINNLIINTKILDKIIWIFLKN